MIHNRKMGAAYAATALLMIGALAMIWARPQPRDLSPGASFPAPPYVRPAGCPLRAWRADDDLPRSCQTYSDLIGSPREFGLGQAYRGYHWLRVGDAALRVWCPHFTLGPCHVYDVVPGRFHDAGD